MEVLQFLNYQVEIIRRPHRRSLLLSMHPDKNMSIKTNIQTTQKQIIDFLISKKNWIEKNSNRFLMLKRQFVEPTCCEGAAFPFLGELKYLHFEVTKKIKIHFVIEDGFLVCYRPVADINSTVNSDVFFSKLKIFYKKESEKYLKYRLNKWTEIIELKPKKLSFRLNKTRWGSCSSNKHISLNWKLICQQPVLIDYVIVHELCHLRHLNHSADFWSLIELHIPNFREVQNTLQQQERLGHFLN